MVKLNRRFKVTFLALVATMGIYFIYALFLVPVFLLPPLSVREAPVNPGWQKNPREEIETLAQRYSDLLAPLFPDADDWRRKQPQAFISKEGDGIILYHGEPVISGDRREITLSSCTLVVPSGDKELSDEERYRRAIVLEAKDNATFILSSPFDLVGTPDFSTFEKGKFQGEVVLRSLMTSPGPEDDFRISTRDISFTPNQILANNEVVFQYGSLRGEGEVLRVELDLARFLKEGVVSAPSSGPYSELVREGNLGAGFSIERITLEKLFRLEFDIETDLFSSSTPGTSGGVLPGVAPKTVAPPVTVSEIDGAPPGGKEKLKVDIRCKRGVFFAPNPDQVAEWAGRFMDDVEVVVYHQTEKEDRLRCRYLYLSLIDEELAERIREIEASGTVSRPKRMPTGHLKRLEPLRVKAIRSDESPANIEIPGRGFRASGDEIVYEIPTKRITLTSQHRGESPLENSVASDSSGPQPEKPAAAPDEPVSLTYQTATVRAQTVDYLASEKEGEFGTLFAGQNGSLAASILDRSGNVVPITASWRDGVRIADDEETPNLLKLAAKGGVKIGLGGFGEIASEEADFWAECHSDKTPDRSETSTGEENAAPGSAVLTKTASNDSSEPKSSDEDANWPKIDRLIPQSARFRGNIRLTTDRGVGEVREEMTIRFQDVLESVQSASGEKAVREEGDSHGGFLGKNGSLFGDGSESTFRMIGGRLDLWFQRAGEKIDVSRMVVRGDIHLTETNHENPDESIQIDGDDVQIENPNSPSASVVLVGRPANFSGKGLAMTGYNIRVDRAKNIFYVIGQGKLSLMDGSGGGLLEGLGKSFGVTSEKDANPPEKAPVPIDVFWSRGMVFDGRTLRFQGDEKTQVVARQQSGMELQTPELRLTLAETLSIFEMTRRISDSQKSAVKERSFDIDSAECLGTNATPVLVTRFGGPTSVTGTDNAAGSGYFQLSVKNIRWRKPTGELNADGPGWIRGITRTPRRSEEDGNGGAVASNANLPTSKIASRPWTHLHLVFSHGLTGNIDHGEVTAVGNVSAVSATSEKSDPFLIVENRETYPDDSFYLSCERLRVALVSDPAAESEKADSANPGNSAKNQSFELTASENALFRFEQYVGRGESLKYSNLKETIVIEGDGINAASISRQDRPGATPVTSSFTRAMFNLRTKRIQADVSTTTIDALGLMNSGSVGK